MRIVIASCSAIYTGRGDTKLEEAVRAILFKEDGSISIHNDKSNKPLNYMGKGNVFTETVVNGVTVWTFDTSKESLQIFMHNIVSDNSFDVAVEDQGLVRDGTEIQLQEWLSVNPQVFGKGYSFVGREHPTGAGPVDLLLMDKDMKPVIVEVKRVAMLASVGQILRYLTTLQEQEDYENVRGILAAVDIRPKTLLLAEKRGIECVTIPVDWHKSFNKP